MLLHLEDIESDMSAFHRVDDIYTMDSRRFFKLAVRLPCYEGVMKMRMVEEIRWHQEHPEQAPPLAPGVALAVGGQPSTPGSPPPGADTIPDPQTLQARRRALYRKAGTG